MVKVGGVRSQSLEASGLMCRHLDEENLEFPGKIAESRGNFVTDWGSNTLDRWKGRRICCDLDTDASFILPSVSPHCFAHHVFLPKRAVAGCAIRQLASSAKLPRTDLSISVNFTNKEKAIATCFCIVDKANLACVVAVLSCFPAVQFRFEMPALECVEVSIFASR